MWMGDWGVGIPVVERDGETASAGEVPRSDGDEPLGRLYGSNRSSWAVKSI
jgi:hypothetical protein